MKIKIKIKIGRGWPGNERATGQYSLICIGPDFVYDHGWRADPLNAMAAEQPKMFKKFLVPRSFGRARRAQMSLFDRTFRVVLLLAFFMGCLTLDGAGLPVLVANTTHRPGDQTEPWVAVNPLNASNIVVIANDNVVYIGLDASVSVDGGKTWSNRLIADGSDSLPPACCDPTASFDQFGNLFVGYLTDPGGVVVAYSLDGGQSFAGYRTVTASTNNDKPVIAVGPGGAYAPASLWVTYLDGTAAAATGLPVMGPSQIGEFLAPSELSGGGNGSFGGIAVGPAGEVMICYQTVENLDGPSKIMVNVNRSGLGPGGFGPAILVTDSNVGAYRYIPAQPNRSVDAGSAVVWDRNARRGRIYMVYTDAPTTNSDNLNIFLTHSDDWGATWSGAIRVNDDQNSKSHFMPGIALDQTSGNMVLSWYDCRNSPDNSTAEFFATVSADGGASLAPNIQVSGGYSSAPLDPDNSGNDYGDYSGVAFFDGLFYPVWADNSNSTKDNPDGTLKDFDIYIGVGQAASVLSQNDNFTNAAVVRASGGVVSGDDTLATVEPGEPAHAGLSNINRSLWWSWTPTASGVAMVGAGASDFAPVLAVYSGNTLAGLAPIVASAQASNLTFQATSGVTYRIAAGSVGGGASGVVRLELISSALTNATSPVLTIARPSNGYLTGAGTVSLSGNVTTAATNASGVASIRFWVNQGRPFSIPGNAIWQSVIPLPPGTNTIFAQAFDYGGRGSSIQSIKVLSVPPTGLVSVPPVPGGSESLDYLYSTNGGVISAAYRLTAVPDANHEFLGWSGGIQTLDAVISGPQLTQGSRFQPEFGPAYDDDFETGDFSTLSWQPPSSTNSFGWQVVPPNYLDVYGPGELTTQPVVDNGNYIAESAPVGAGQKSQLLLAGTMQAGPASFDYYVSSATNSARFKFLLNGVLVLQASGEVGWTRFSYQMPSGQDSLEWRYEKAGSQTSGQDLAAIDNVKLPLRIILGAPLRPLIQTGTGPAGLELRVLGQTNQVYVMEGSTNLLNWLPLSTNYSPNALVRFADPSASQVPIRFYRTKAP